MEMPAVAAFLIAEILEVRDENAYAGYRARVDATVTEAGGRYLARGGEIDVLEGQWHPKRVVVVKFDSVRAARDWWKGERYRELRAMRQQATRTNMILIQGVPDEVR